MSKQPAKETSSGSAQALLQDPQFCSVNESLASVAQRPSRVASAPYALSRRLLRWRRIDGEVSEPHFAIQNLCRECRGFESDKYSTLSEEVSNCGRPGCWLWTWRNSKQEHGPPGERSTLKVYDRDRLPDDFPTVRTAIRNFCGGWCLCGGTIPAMSRAIRECPDLNCHLWPWRLGAFDPCALTIESEADDGARD